MWAGIGSITDPLKLQVAVRVGEAMASQVKLGQEVVITAEGVLGRRFRGRVSTIGTVAHKVDPFEDVNAVTNERVFDVAVKILDVDPKVLRPGMKARAKFVFRRLSKARYVPLAAVIHRPGEGEFVYVTHGSGFQPREIGTGERNDEAVVVTRGLRGGERVALGDPTKAETE